MKFVLINGCSCAGKSTVVSEVMAKKEHFFHLSGDSLKWSFSQYNRDTHADDTRRLVRAVAESVCEMGYDIICDSALHVETRTKLLEIPEKYGYEIIEINLEAEYPVLVGRFDIRVADAQKNQSKRISNTSKERFREIYEIYESGKNPMAITFRTDKETVDEIVMKIIDLI